MDDPKTAARWVSAWSTSPIDASLSESGVLDRLGVAVTDISARTAVLLTAGGTHVRLTLSNIFGVLPLHVAACTIAIGADDARGIDPATLRTVTFGGQTHVRIGAGESCTSDAAALPVAAGQTLAVTVFYRGINAMRTIGLIGGCSHAELGNCTRRTLLHMAVPMQHTADSGAYEVIPALTEIDVLAAAGTHACVIFGDSTVANELPRLLAARLRADGIGNVSVTQAAIKGDRLVADGVGRAAKLLGGAGVKRFARDVLAQAGADMVLVKLGENDLIHPHCQSKQGLLTPVTFAQMTAGYRALADMAHAQGMRIWFCELTPWKGYTRNLFGRGYQVQLQGFFSWRRTSGVFSFTNPRVYDTDLSFGNDIYYIYDYWDDFTKETIGDTIRFGYPIGEYTSVGIGYRLERYDLYNVDADASPYISDYKGTNWTSAISARILRDTTDDRARPTKGTIARLWAEYGGGGLGGTDNFIKAVADWQGFWSINPENTFHLRARVGGVFQNTSSRVPVFERFWLGGMDTVRGYSYSDLSPRDDKYGGDQIGGDRMGVLNVEYIWTFQKDMGLALVPFFDAGFNIDHKTMADDFNDKIVYSAGLELRWRSPMGDLRLAYGYPLSKDYDGEREQGRLEFSMGQFF